MQGRGAMAIDPVCKMVVMEDSSTERVEYRKKTYHFCGKGCKEQFEKDPEYYLGKGTVQMNGHLAVAYFSMEVGLEAEMPTYSGGLGALAGDTIRAAADLKIPMVAVTLLHRQGYCRQKLEGEGNQTEEPVEWKVEDYLQELPVVTSLKVEGQDVVLRPWVR